ncbi:MAG TPA: DUF3501 family protein [Alphaproteobacteria bacterium]|nr:DUF3501 family protein [Alphaproteobacteria bacterium]
MTRKTSITRDDILSMDDYARIRAAKRRDLRPIKIRRRVAVGPYATFYFENYETMWHQVHEMLFIERGGEEQIADELEAYNPLIPQGRDLAATVMFEIDDPVRRKTFLSKLGGVEETMTLEFEGHTVSSVAEEDVDRTTADGKASSVQFVHFPMTDEQAALFKRPDTRVALGITHPAYPHLTILPEEVREELARDLD